MKKTIEITNEMAVYYGDSYNASFYKFTIRPERNHSLPHIHLYVKKGEPSINIEIKLIEDLENDELNILTSNTISKTSWDNKVAKDIKRMFSDKSNIKDFIKDYGITLENSESFNNTNIRVPITTVSKILLEHKEQCEYWFDKSKGLHMGMYYDLNDKLGNNTIVVYTDKFKNYFLLQYKDNRIIPLYSDFSEDMDDLIMNKLISSKNNLRTMCEGYERSLRVIERTKRIFQNNKDND